ncbi:hypothetical protein RLIN73S_00501 [Rhodanobacter lindaniclasticus]
MVSSSIQLTSLLATGNSKPCLTKALRGMLNSRTATASPPSGDSEIRQRSNFGFRHCTPLNTQRLPSAWFSASMSSSTSHFGSTLRYSASVVRRQTPRGCALSRQKLYR